jgi:hypothetical protein
MQTSHAANRRAYAFFGLMLELPFICAPVSG